MTSKIRYLVQIAFLFTLIFTISTCKKYPENTLWFTRVKKIAFFDNVKLTGFTVNGIDSMPFANDFFGRGARFKNYNDCAFGSGYLDNDGCSLTGVFNPGSISSSVSIDPAILIPYNYSKNKKCVTIEFGRFGIFDTAVFKRNLFIDNTTPWQIIKLIPNGTRKIKKTVNNNTYELQFDKK